MTDFHRKVLGVVRASGYCVGTALVIGILFFFMLTKV